MSCDGLCFDDDGNECVIWIGCASVYLHGGVMSLMEHDACCETLVIDDLQVCLKEVSYVGNPL